MRAKHKDGLERVGHVAGTKGSNPACSCGESANHRFLSGAASSGGNLTTARSEGRHGGRHWSTPGISPPPVVAEVATVDPLAPLVTSAKKTSVPRAVSGRPPAARGGDGGAVRCGPLRCALQRARFADGGRVVLAPRRSAPRRGSRSPRVWRKWWASVYASSPRLL